MHVTKRVPIATICGKTLETRELKACGALRATAALQNLHRQLVGLTFVRFHTKRFKVCAIFPKTLRHPAWKHPPPMRDPYGTRFV